MYAGQSPKVALAEVLAHFQQRAGTDSGLEKDAAFLDLSRDEFARLVEEEWESLGHMPPGHVARSWRAVRRLHAITLPADGA